MATVEAIFTSWLDGAYGLDCVLLQIVGHSVASYLPNMQYIKIPWLKPFNVSPSPLS